MGREIFVFEIYSGVCLLATRVLSRLVANNSTMETELIQNLHLGQESLLLIEQ